MDHHRLHTTCPDTRRSMDTDPQASDTRARADEDAGRTAPKVREPYVRRLLRAGASGTDRPAASRKQRQDGRSVPVTGKPDARQPHLPRAQHQPRQSRRNAQHQPDLRDQYHKGAHIPFFFRIHKRIQDRGSHPDSLRQEQQHPHQSHIRGSGIQVPLHLLQAVLSSHRPVPRSFRNSFFRQ